MSRRPLLVLACVALLTVWAYRAIWTAGFVYEDAHWLPTFTGGTSISLATLMYAPWTLAAWMGHGAPWAFHGLLLLVHLGNGLLIYRLTRAIGSPTAALIAASLYWLHPVNTESVAYLSAGRELFACWWVLCALVIGLHSSSPWWRITGIGLCTALAITSKASAAPALLLVPFGVWALGDRALLRRGLALWIGLALLVSLPGALYVVSLHAREQTVLIGGPTALPYSAYTAAALLRGLLLIVVPVGFTVDVDWIAQPALYPTVAFLLLLVSAALAWEHRRRWPIPAACVAWMLVAIGPRFVVQQVELLNEHQLTLALLPVWGALGLGIDAAVRAQRAFLARGNGTVYVC